MTKLCKACKEPIDQAATKCPRCQVYQSWYRNPRMLSLLWLLPLAFLIWSPFRHVNPVTKFADYKDKLSVSVVEETAPAKGTGWLVTVRIENQSDQKWRRPNFQIESLDGNDKLLCVEHVNAYNVVVDPKTSAFTTLSLHIIPAGPVAKRRVTLTDLDSSRF
jgi:hypothetical protein